MIASFFGVWFQLIIIFCVVLLLGGGLPAIALAFWPIVHLAGLLAFFSTTIAFEVIRRETTEQLQKK